MLSSLMQLSNSIKGVALMSKDLEQMFDSLLFKKVPQIWQSVSYPSVKSLYHWVDDMGKRVIFFRR